MSSYYVVVNPAKRQFLDPDRFGEASKFNSVLEGGHCLRALKMLIMDYGCNPNAQSRFLGAWVGDPIILAGDDDGYPNPGGYVTSTAENPNRNLWEMARDEFTNISYRALAELCEDESVVLELVEKAERDVGFLVDLVHVWKQYKVPLLRVHFSRTFGTRWQRKYTLALKERHKAPLPPVDLDF